MSVTTFLRLASTCSIVGAARLTERRTAMNRTAPSTRVDCTSRPVSGAKRISFSCGYCESHERSAPRSTMPICISKMVDASVCSPLPDEVSALDEGSIHDRGASPEKLRDIDGEAEDDVSDLGSPRVILDDDVSELTEARA